MTLKRSVVSFQKPTVRHLLQYIMFAYRRVNQSANLFKLRFNKCDWFSVKITRLEEWGSNQRSLTLTIPKYCECYGSW